MNYCCGCSDPLKVDFSNKDKMVSNLLQSIDIPKIERSGAKYSSNGRNELGVAKKGRVCEGLKGGDAVGENMGEGVEAEEKGKKGN